MPTPEELDDLDWDCESEFEAMAWAASVAVRPAPGREWQTFAHAAIKAARAALPIKGWSVEGFVVPIYMGHLVYRDEIYVAPQLSVPCWPAHVVVLEDTVANVFLEKKWHCGARRLTAVSATAAEDWWFAGSMALEEESSLAVGT